MTTHDDQPQTPPFDQFVTFLPVADLERSTRFYQGTLGLPLALDQGRCRIFRVDAGSRAFLGVCQRDEVPTMTGLFLTLVSDDVDEWHRRLVAAGVPIERAPMRNEEYNVYHLFARDPDGHLVEIQRFESPDWPRVT